VLFGGRSAEHDISRITARHVLAAIDPGRYAIDAIGIDHEGNWHRADGALAALALGPDALPEALVVEGPIVDPYALLSQPDVVVLPLLHGPNGEDGTVQGLFEVASVTYVGSGVLGSAMSMDKIAAKHLAAAIGFAQTTWVGLHRSEVTGAGLEAALVDLPGRLGFPMFVKPANIFFPIPLTEYPGVSVVVVMKTTPSLVVNCVIMKPKSLTTTSCPLDSINQLVIKRKSLKKRLDNTHLQYIVISFRGCS
jgi:D-alanine-D-alanine ligase